MRSFELSDDEIRLIRRLRSLRQRQEFHEVRLSLRPLAIVEKVSRQLETLEYEKIPLPAPAG